MKKSLILGLILLLSVMFFIAFSNNNMTSKGVSKLPEADVLKQDRLLTLDFLESFLKVIQLFQEKLNM